MKKVLCVTKQITTFATNNFLNLIFRHKMCVKSLAKQLELFIQIVN